MEEKNRKNIYFLYTQKGENNNISEIDTNDKIKKVNEIHKEIYRNYIEILYKLEVLLDKEEKEIKIPLINIQGDYYYAYIRLNDTELDVNIDDIIIFKVQFKPYNYTEGNYLNQIYLPYNEQFDIFERNFSNQENILVNLYASIVSQVLLVSKTKYDFIINFFLKIYDKKKFNKFPRLKSILKYFFKNIIKILRNCEVTESSTTSEEKTDILSDTENIRTELIEITGVNDENIDIFLAFYYIHYRKKLFVKFIDNQKYKEKINITLKNNRDIFNNFTTDIITPELMDEAENGLQLLSLIQLYPNLVECFKILGDYAIFCKFSNYKLTENRGINIMNVGISPKKTDNINLLYEYFKKCYEYFQDYGVYPLVIKEDFFVTYYKIFAEQDEDFDKNIKIIDMFNLYNSKNKIKIKSQEIFNLHMAKGISLMKEKKLKNIDLIEFLNHFSNLSAVNEEFVKYFHNGIEFSEKDNDFINDILTKDKYNLQSILGNSYRKVFEKIFEKYIIPKDLVALMFWNIDDNTPEIILDIFLKTIKRIWLNYPENNMYGLFSLFAMEFGMASVKLQYTYKSVIDELEEKIDKLKLMPIYSELLLNGYRCSYDFEEQVKNYIQNYNELSPLYIWYLMTTYPDDCSRIDILKNYLEEGGKFYAVNYTDFSQYPQNIGERLLLFTKLKNKKILQDYFEDSDYYRDSMNSKNELEKNVFIDGLKMQSNLEKIQTLLEQFFLDEGENMDDIFSLMINFTDIIDQAKKYYNSLKLIYNFWTAFFPKVKKDELIKLKNKITEFEKTKIEECLSDSELDKTYLDFIEDAEKGKILHGSIIFMEIYNSLNEIKESENENYKLSLVKFNNLEKLGENCNLDVLEDDIKNYIINAVYKKIDLLNEELNFIKIYFKFGEDNRKNNYDIKNIRNQIINLVKIKQKELGDYKININENFLQDLEEKDEDNNFELLDKNNENIINIITNDDNNNNPLDLKKEPSSDNKNMQLEEVLKMKNEIKNLSNLIIYKSNIFCKEDFEDFYEKFSQFYVKIFNIGMGFGKLTLKDIYEEIIPLSNKIICITKNLGILNNIENYKYKGELLLISELNYFIQLVEKYKTINKKIYVNIFMYFKKLYINSRIANNFVEEDLDKLFEFTNVNISNNPNIFLEILLNEYIKNKDLHIVKYILNNNYLKLYEDMLPIMDQIFKDEILKKLKYNIQGNINYLEFNSNEFIEVNKTSEEKENFAEMLLFYFENKIMSEMNKSNKKEKDFFSEENINQCLEFCLEFLELEFNQKNDKSLSVLFAISFVKSYLYKLIKYSYYNEEFLQDDYLFGRIMRLGQNSSKLFRTTLKLFIFKLLFRCCGNLSDFSIYDLKQYQIIERDIGQNFIKNYGFDYLFTPLKLGINDEVYNSIISKLYNQTQIEIVKENDINEGIKCNLDLFFCISVNFLFSFYYNKEILMNMDENKDEIYKWIEEKINSEENELLKKNKEIKNIITYFMDIDGKKQVYKEFVLLKYDQILSLLISARFILNTISSEKKESFYYKLLFDAKSVISDKTIIFIDYYLKDFDLDIIDKRKLSCLAYKLINYIILSHIFFGFKLNLIESEDIKKILPCNNLENNNKNNISDFILDNLFKEFDFIKNILIPLLGINSIIIFMDSFFKNLYLKIYEIESNNSIDEIVNKNDQLFDTIVNNTITHYQNSVKEYYKYEENIDKKNKNEIKIIPLDITDKGEDNNDLKDILLEKPKFYNNKKKLDNKYPLLSYFTYTNFSVADDDFRNQYIYYSFSSTDFPFISSIFSSDIILEIVDYLPKLNNLNNKVYDKLNMRISENVIKSKKIKEEFNNELNQDLNEFNKFIEKNNKLFDINKKINNEQNIFEIINIPGSTINYVYTKIIEIYNDFLKKMKYGNNNKLIDEVIIQEAKENDYNFNYIQIEADKKMTIKQKLDELILLYSSRERKNNNYINVYDGGKIIYNYEIIENKLEETFIFGKKYFSKKQKTFIFHQDIFNQENNILKEFVKKYAQNEKNKYDMDKIEEYIDKNIKVSSSNIVDLFYELYFIFKYLSQNDCNFKINNDEKSINDIIKYFELKSYKLPQLKKAKESLDHCLLLNNIFHFYEIVFNKAFIYLRPELKDKLIADEISIEEEAKNKIKEILQSNSIITSDVLFTAVKKYILRYVKNDDKNIIFPLNNLLEKKNDVWDTNISFTEIFLKELNKLFAIEFGKTAIIYCYLTIYDINFDAKKTTIIYDEDKENEDGLLD